MKGKLFFFLLLLGAGGIGFWWGQSKGFSPLSQARAHPDKEFPLVERKSFVLIVYAHNKAAWCERALRSIFEQEYDGYRVIFVDDASTDETFQKAKAFILENHQESKVILMRNETRLGPVACLYRMAEHWFNQEIAIPLDAKNWLTDSGALTRLNRAYQNPDVWVAVSPSLTYPSYEFSLNGLHTFYGSLFKKLRLDDLFREGKFATHVDSYLQPILDLAGERICHLKEPLLFSNQAVEQRESPLSFSPTPYSPLSLLPVRSEQKEQVDLVLFSFDRPLQLYACLESIHRYMSGYEHLFVIYRVSDERFAKGYEVVKQSFPKVHYLQQSQNPKRDFKPLVLQTVFETPAKYILFGVDDIIVKDGVDLPLCVDLMEQTGAYGFYLRCGKHIDFCYQSGRPQAVPPSIAISQNVYAWDLKTGEDDWGFPNNLDMTLFRKSDLKEALETMKYKTPNSLESGWAKKYAPKQAIGLYFEQSKIVNIPLNVVGRTGNPHMHFASPEELLAKFNEGWKIDIAPLHAIENTSPHYAFTPGFVPR